MTHSPNPASWSAHHGVPAGLAVVFDFINTLDERSFGGRHGRDDLPDPPALAAWLAGRALVPAHTKADADDLDLALRLRAVLRACAEANRTGQLDPRAAQDAAAIHDALPLRARVRPNGGLRLTPAPAGVRGALAAILASAVLATAEGSWGRVKMCAAEDCKVVFYDHSKPRNAKWCETAGCGNRVKTRAYRRRRREATAGA